MTLRQPEPPTIDIDMSRVHDIVSPEAVSYAPQTVGWYVLGLLALAAVVWVALRWLRGYRARRYRRDGLAELAILESQLRDPTTRIDALERIPVLVKRVGLAAFPREQVAALSGDAWLARLDASMGGNAFARGPGQLLPTLAYAPASSLETVADDHVRALVDLVRRWIRNHRA